MALQQLGPFKLYRVLGRGGMGTVYEACEDGSDVRVAVKALAPQYSFDERFRLRFEGEIDALMKLEHANIVRLLSYGQDEGNLFFAMELVDGCSLFQEQKKGQVFHWREIVDIGIQVCAGLRHAHDRGIIHRDLKPGNLMIDANRQVKITDFGIAKSFGSSSVTREGNVLGTMDFMAPEQARGEAVTVRSDLFSLGAVLYSLLAGRPPFLQETVEQTFESLLSPNPPVRLDKIAKDTPAPLALLIHRLLEKDPEKRLATAMAVGRQLQHVEEAIQGSLDSETQVVEAESAESGIQLGETFTPGPRPVPGSVTGGGGDDSSAVTRLTDVEDEISENLANQPDYFNEVTPQQRQKSSTPGRGELAPAEESTSSAWPLMAGLVIVIGLLAYGVWYTVIRKPGAEELLATIRQAEKSPTRVQDDLQLFQSVYPDHEMIAYVNDLADYAGALKFRNTLQLQQRSPRAELTEIEEQFLEITEMKETEAPAAIERMESYLKFHADNESLSNSDARVIQNAWIFRARIRAEADRQVSKGLENIQVGMQRAEKSSSTVDKLDRYRFIVEMYGDDKWAADLVEICRQRIKTLEQQGNEAPADPSTETGDQDSDDGDRDPD